MPTATSTNALWIDYDWDREYASDGSRYKAYLEDRRRQFEEIEPDDPTAEFVALAWRIARSPIMSPGFVRDHPRVLSADVQRNDWDGTLMADVEVISDLPAVLHRVKPARSGFFHGWSRNFSGEYEGVTGEDVTKRPYLLPRLQLLVKLPMDTLHKLAEVPTGKALFPACVAVVEELVGLMNEQIHPVLRALES